MPATLLQRAGVAPLGGGDTRKPKKASGRVRRVQCYNRRPGPRVSGPLLGVESSPEVVKKTRTRLFCGKGGATHACEVGQHADSVADRGEVRVPPYKGTQDTPLVIGGCDSCPRMEGAASNGT